jgi:TatD DNase family protein
LPASAFVDTHCHLDSEQFNADREAVLGRAAAAGVRRILIPAINVASAHAAIGLAEQHAGLYAAVGIHPTEAGAASSDDVRRLAELLQHEKVVAIGEIGLDYYWVTDTRSRSRQRQLLEAQLELAATARRPVILHMREEADADRGACAEDLLRILTCWVRTLQAREGDRAAQPGVLHSFSGSLATARAALHLGFCLGVTGPITFPKAHARRTLIASLPLESLLLETDAPFLAPVPHRGSRNEPAYVPLIADRIAQVQSRSVGEVARLTSANAARLFGWGATL